MHRSRPVSLIFASGCCAMIGCGGSGQHDASRPPPGSDWQTIKPAPTTTNTQDRAIAVQARPTLVKQGHTPLVYFVETGDPVVIVVTDLTTNQRLASVPVGGRTIVRVESAKGVFVGSDNVAPGPLPGAHQFGIYVEVSQQSMMRHETIGPVEGTKP